MDKTKLGTGSVPVRVAAMAYGKEASWIRAGIIAGWLPIGEATRNGVKITSIEQMNSKYGCIVENYTAKLYGIPQYLVNLSYVAPDVIERRLIDQRVDNLEIY